MPSLGSPSVSTGLVCPFPGCGKSFKRPDYLTRHRSIHNDVRPHVCEQCSISFTRKDLLNKHKKSKIHLKGQSPHSVVFINTGSDDFPERKKPKRQFSDRPLASSGRFSNVSNSVEDSFWWLFGEDPAFDYDDIYRSSALDTDFYSHPTLPTDLTDSDDDVDFGFSEGTLAKIDSFLKSDVGLEENNISLICSRKQLNRFLSQYWNEFSMTYPIIHKPTFEVNALEKLNVVFLLSMVTIGMVCTDAMDSEGLLRDIALEVQRHLRVKILGFLETMDYNIAFVPLKLLQSLLLTGIFHMYYGDQLQRRKFHIYHPVTINVFKELKLFVDLNEPPCDQNNFNFSSWCQWIRYESLKRIALFAYALDTQQSFILLHSPTISVFDIQLEMPYTDSVWSAENPAAFLCEYRRLPRDFVPSRNPGSITEFQTSRYEEFDSSGVISNGNLIPNVRSEGRWPNLLWSLKRLLQPYTEDPHDQEYHYNCFSQFSRFILLHGALSLVRELRTTSFVFSDLKGIVSKGKLNDVAAKIEQGLFIWRSHFQVNIARANAVSLSVGSEKFDSDDLSLNIYDTSSIFWANITLHHAALLGLYCNINMIVQYGDITVNKHNPVSQLPVESPGKLKFNAVETTKNTILVQSWARSKDGEHSIKQACLLLRTVSTDESMVFKVPHLPSVMYLAVLVCWAYSRNSAQQENLTTPSNSPSMSSKLECTESDKSDALTFISLVLNTYDGLSQLDNPVKSKKELVKGLILYVFSILQGSNLKADDSGIADGLISLVSTL